MMDRSVSVAARAQSILIASDRRSSSLFKQDLFRKTGIHLCGSCSRHARAALLPVLLALGGCGGSFVGSDLGLAGAGCTHPQERDGWRPGCATHRNMAAMAADPKDLTRARAEAPSDAMRRDAVIAAYAGKRSGGGQAPVMAGVASDRGGSQ
jgi:hypothetical protein